MATSAGTVDLPLPSQYNPVVVARDAFENHALTRLRFVDWRPRRRHCPCPLPSRTVSKTTATTYRPQPGVLRSTPLLPLLAFCACSLCFTPLLYLPSLLICSSSCRSIRMDTLSSGPITATTEMLHKFHVTSSSSISVCCSPRRLLGYLFLLRSTTFTGNGLVKTASSTTEAFLSAYRHEPRTCCSVCCSAEFEPTAQSIVHGWVHMSFFYFPCAAFFSNPVCTMKVWLYCRSGGRRINDPLQWSAFGCLLTLSFYVGKDNRNS